MHHSREGENRDERMFRNGKFSDFRKMVLVTFQPGMIVRKRDVQ